MPLAEDEALVLTPTAAISSWHSPKRSLVMCTPPEARGSILRDCFHLWRVGHPTGRQGRIKAPFAGTICSTPFLKPLLFEHGREALYRVRGRGILRSSQSPSNALTPEGPFAGCAFHRRGRIVESLRVRKAGDSSRWGIGSDLRGKERAMDARSEAASRQVGSDDAITTRIGAVALPLGIVLIAISEIFHPSREDPMDFPAVFEEYAQSDVWTTVHLGEYCGFLLLLGGL